MRKNTPALECLNLVEREEAKAISESEMTPAEPVTVILSEMGWVRCAKGHDIDPAGLS